jgi:regulator of Ty1 transposition protein 103
MYHRKRYKHSVKVWEREFYKGKFRGSAKVMMVLLAPRERRLTFLYLANDIIQTSRKKGGEFIKEFARIIDACMALTYK